MGELDTCLAAVNAAGMLSFFNREYRVRRLAAHAACRSFLPYAEAHRRLRMALASTGLRTARESRGELLMKGSLHTDELMRAVTSATTGLRTARRISQRARMPLLPLTQNQPLGYVSHAIPKGKSVSEELDQSAA